jgi:hypothetical protein
LYLKFFISLPVLHVLARNLKQGKLNVYKYTILFYEALNSPNLVHCIFFYFVQNMYICIRVDLKILTVKAKTKSFSMFDTLVSIRKMKLNNIGQNLVFG